MFFPGGLQLELMWLKVKKLNNPIKNQAEEEDL